MVIIRQNAEEAPFRFRKTVLRGKPPDFLYSAFCIALSVRFCHSAIVIGNAKIRGKLHSRLLLSGPKELCRKIDYIAIRAAAEAVIPLIQLQARRVVIMERAARHPVSSNLQPVKFCRLSCGYFAFYCLKNIVAASLVRYTMTVIF